MKNVYYFTADWCSPCKKMKPIVEEINRDNSLLRFQIIDADFEIDLVNKYNIRSIPTFILIDDQGNEINRMTGAKIKEELESFING